MRLRYLSRHSWHRQRPGDWSWRYATAVSDARRLSALVRCPCCACRLGARPAGPPKARGRARCRAAAERSGAALIQYGSIRQRSRSHQARIEGVRSGYAQICFDLRWGAGNVWASSDDQGGKWAGYTLGYPHRQGPDSQISQAQQFCLPRNDDLPDRDRYIRRTGEEPPWCSCDA
jgi:hypothetical protein